ncbi:MAG: hypothetical protein KAZ18_00360 [Acinetobacter sp.]|nr:hypothetical protein [Acinetobacter sp.]
MAKRVPKKDTKKSQNSAAQAAEDLNVIFPDSTIVIAGENIVVTEYPFIKWLELKVHCGDLLEAMSELLAQGDQLSTDDVLEFFENNFQEIEFLIRESIQRDFEFLESLNDTDMQNLIFTWWRVNRHFFLRSAYRLQRTKIKQSAGPTSSSA